MRALAAALALATVLAGCLAPTPAETLDPASVADDAAAVVGLDGVAHGANGTLLPLPDGAARAVGAAFEIGLAAVEPTLGVDADGSLYMTALRDGPLNAPTVLRSDDQGATWDDVGAPAHRITFDPYVYVDPATGRVFQDDIQPVGCGTLSFSDDKGATWITNPLGCGNPQVNDHQTLVAAKPRRLATVGYDNVVYRCVNNVAYPACAVSVNGGISFLPQVPLVAELGVDPEYDAFVMGLPVCSSLTGHLKADSEGRVFLPISDCTITTSPPLVAVTEDDGATWTVRTISEDVLSDDHEVAIAVDEADNLHAVWASEGRLFLASSADHGATWTAPVDVTAPGVTATAFRAAAGGAPGKLAFAYVGTTFEGGYEDKDAPEDWEGATWNGYMAVVEDALGTPLVQTVTVNDPADPLARDQCGRTRCRGMTDFIELVIDVEGRPWATFVDVCADGCEDAPTEGGNMGLVGTLRAGPSLRGASALVPLP